MDIYIKNMVCGRCIKIINGIFNEMDIPVKQIDLGKVVSYNELQLDQLNVLKEKLLAEGFEVIDDQRSKLVEQVKNIIVELVHYKNLDELNINLSTYLSAQLHKDYSYISNLFSSLESTTIEQYFIQQKIEKVKEWLVYDELTLSEMAFKLNYSSVAHLSNQFKKMTGFTPSEFKKLKEHHRKPLDKV